MKQKDFDRLNKELLLIAPNEIKIRQEFMYKRWFFIFEHEELGTIRRIYLRKKDFNRESIFVCEIHAGNNLCLHMFCSTTPYKILYVL